MRQIETFFYRQVPTALYHYTGISGLLGMARSKSVWASNAYYLNDSREVVHACDVLDDALMPHLAFGNPSTPEARFLHQLKEWVNQFRRTHFNIFIFSLSAESSLLSQWRSYTPHGKGVSVGFSPEMLSRIAEESSSVLARCLYEADEQREIIDSLLEKIRITFRQRESDIDISRAHPDQCYFKFLEEFRGDFLRVLCSIKHSAFSEENEWRLISPYYHNYTVAAVKFREGASMLVPYIQLPLPKTGPVFDEVILGPSPHQNLSMSALSMYLSNGGLCNRTSNSSLPYREWS